ncbi:MAG: hypothetical protein A2283_12410 [Lentisphaerae bacterium RIFOXYA12_FULL_48_11]|nr:MAG: hypothetical protein A2283_12410 [Lentisphaerae bacterium RIFOXYA12_FULL_48_11]
MSRNPVVSCRQANVADSSRSAFAPMAHIVREHRRAKGIQEAVHAYHNADCHGDDSGERIGEP